MKKYKEEILARLIDKYERSKSFIGTNEVNQSFSLDLVKAFPEYADDAKVNEIGAVDQAVKELSEAGWIRTKRHKNGLLSGVTLELSALQDCYGYLKRKPKRDLNRDLSVLLSRYYDRNEITQKFCGTQLERLSSNKKAEFFNGDIKEYEKILIGLSNILSVEQETYERDFSVRVFGDSKTFEKIRGTLTAILFEYGDFSNRETVLEDLNIVKNPGHVYFKGSGVISLAGQRIDLSKVHGDLAVSSRSNPKVSSLSFSRQSVIFSSTGRMRPYSRIFHKLRRSSAPADAGRRPAGQAR